MRQISGESDVGQWSGAAARELAQPSTTEKTTAVSVATLKRLAERSAEEPNDVPPEGSDPDLASSAAALPEFFAKSGAVLVIPAPAESGPRSVVSDLEAELEREAATEVEPEPQTEIALQPESELPPETELPTEIETLPETELRTQNETETETEHPTAIETRMHAHAHAHAQTPTPTQTQTPTQIEAQPEPEPAQRLVSRITPAAKPPLRPRALTLRPAPLRPARHRTRPSLAPARSSSGRLLTLAIYVALAGVLATKLWEWDVGGVRERVAERAPTVQAVVDWGKALLSK